MGFCRKGNQHDRWASERDGHRDLIARTGLPGELFARESTLKAFLTYGTFGDSGADLASLTDEQFAALRQLADIVLPDCRDVWVFTAECRRRDNRSPGHGLADAPGRP